MKRNLQMLVLKKTCGNLEEHLLKEINDLTKELITHENAIRAIEEKMWELPKKHYS